MKTYKGTDKDMICSGGGYPHKFEIGVKDGVAGKIILCINGFHSCEKLEDVFGFYPFNGKNRFFECKVSGEIVHGENKLASRKIKLIRELDEGEVALAAVQRNGCALHYVNDQTPEICLAAVQQDGYSLQYVKDQTPEICLAAVQRNSCALYYVNDQTPEICLAAVQRNGCALYYVNDQTPEICLAAVQQDGYSLQYVKDQTPEICLAAVQQNGCAAEFVKDPVLRETLRKETQK